MNKYYKLENGILISPTLPFIINGRQYYNPTKEMYNQEGYKEVISDEVPIVDDFHHLEYNYTQDDEYIYQHYTVVKNEGLVYSDVVVTLIRRKYSLDDELAIQRQRDSKPEEFNEYNTYCEECKVEAKKIIDENITLINGGNLSI